MPQNSKPAGPAQAAAPGIRRRKERQRYREKQRRLRQKTRALVEKTTRDGTGEWAAVRLSQRVAAGGLATECALLGLHAAAAEAEVAARAQPRGAGLFSAAFAAPVFGDAPAGSGARYTLSRLLDDGGFVVHRWAGEPGPVRAAAITYALGIDGAAAAGAAAAGGAAAGGPAQ